MPDETAAPEAQEEPQKVYDEEVQQVLDLAKSMAEDADKCLAEANKSAGKRARKALNEIKKACTPLRKRLLEVTSAKSD